VLEQVKERATALLLNIIATLLVMLLLSLRKMKAYREMFHQILPKIYHGQTLVCDNLPFTSEIWRELNDVLKRIVNEGTRGAEVETRKRTNAPSYPNSMVMNTDESCKHW